MGHCSADYVHAVVEGHEAGPWADRDAHYGDPLFVDVPNERLAVRRIYRASAAFDRHGASRAGCPSRRPARHEGTTGRRRVPRPESVGTDHVRGGRPLGHGRIGHAERECLSRAGGTGSTGVSYGNRLRSLNTTPGHPNCIAPGKRPRITLTPHAGAQRRLACVGHQRRGRRRPARSGDFEPLARLCGVWDAAGRRSCLHRALPRTTHEDSFDPNPVREQTFIQAGSLAISSAVDCRGSGTN